MSPPSSPAPAPPVPPARPGRPRAALGLVDRNDLAAVWDGMRGDLRDIQASGLLTMDQILSRYAAWVQGDPHRLNRATNTFRRALANGQQIKEDELADIVDILYNTGLAEVPARFFLRCPPYNIREHYFLSSIKPVGPRVPRRPRVEQRYWQLLGHRIGFPIGVPASVLTDNSEWIHYFASNGFNVLTYRTVRSRRHDPNPTPNWVFLPEQRAPLPLSAGRHTVLRAEPSDWIDPRRRDISTSNSFGVPSLDPPDWRGDLENAFLSVAADQLLIVSVLGDLYPEELPDVAVDERRRRELLIEDFARVATQVESAGASVVELNLSCPNSLAEEEEAGVREPLCLERPDVAIEIVAAVRSALESRTRIVAKLAYMPEEPLRSVIEGIRDHIDGIAGINTLQCTLKRRTADEFTFGQRKRAGVSGIAIRDHALEFVRNVSRIRFELGKPFDILGMGGVTDPASFAALYHAGADAVQSASGVFGNPFLADDCVRELGDTLPSAPLLSDGTLRAEAKAVIRDVIKKKAPLDKYTLAALLPLRPSQSHALLDELVGEGTLTVRRSGGTSDMYSA